MLKKHAEIQPVRPFKSVSLDQEPDLDFRHWATQHPGPYALEIGAGVGWHSIQWAKANPNQNIISIERTKVKFERFQSRLSNNNVPNLFARNEEARKWLPINMKENSISTLFLLYPNPYPKEKQANKRWHRSPFFHYLMGNLIPFGKVHLATNEKFYASEALRYMEGFWNLNLESKKELNSKSFKSPRTHFEKKYLKRGNTLYDLTFSKKA